MCNQSKCECSMTEHDKALAKLKVGDKMHAVNGFSVPAPETKVPSIGTTVFIADPARERWYSYTSWCTALYDRLWFARGLVFLNRDDAIANAKAMCFIDPDLSK